MKVLIDNQVYENQKFGGISRYFDEIAKENSNIIRMELFQLPYVSKKNIPKRIKNKMLRLFDAKNQPITDKYYFYNSQITNLNYDLFHPTYYHNYFLDQLKVPLVLTVHDMIHEKYPEYFGYSRDSYNKRKLCEAAGKIIAISESTKKDLIDIFEIPEAKIEVIYHSTNFNLVTPHKPVLEKEINHYLLFTGNRNSYKNFLTFLIAVAPVLNKKGIHLICTGSPFSEVEKRWICDLFVQDKVVHHYCNDNELVFLYQNALCFVFPSLYEGFGFPLLEAFACGCPVASSPGGSLKEIGADAALYFNPKDILDIRETISNIIKDNSLRKDLVESGKQRLKDFSWDKCRKETNLLYSKLV